MLNTYTYLLCIVPCNICITLAPYYCQHHQQYQSPYIRHTKVPTLKQISETSIYDDYMTSLSLRLATSSHTKYEPNQFTDRFS